MGELSKLETAVRSGALRWVHALDLDPHSRTYGVGDRLFWAWKTRDFSNGTWQGGLAGFLDAIPLLPFTSDEIRKIVMATVRGTRKIQRPNGSFEEAYPRECSYAVTGLVGFNLLYALVRYRDYFSKSTSSELENVLNGIGHFIERASETHGQISNHVATSSLFLWMWDHYQGHVNRADLRLEVLYGLATDEGWFPEYGGADPGYQTLLNHYLVAAACLYPMPAQLRELLGTSAGFASLFCFEDGTFAGEIGARGTSICYPSGLWRFDKEPTALTSFDWWVKKYLEAVHAVTPSTVDEGNFVPVFNSWALSQRLASVHLARENVSSKRIHVFPSAGLVVGRSSRAQIVVSTRNGAFRKVVLKDDGKWIDESIVGWVKDGKSTQLGCARPTDVSEEKVVLSFGFGSRRQPLNDAMRGTILRFLGFIFYPFPKFQHVLKNILARFVMSPGAVRAEVSGKLKVDLEHDDFPVVLESPLGSDSTAFGFHRHMASANTFEPRGL